MVQEIKPYVWHHFWLGLLIMLGGWGMWECHPDTGATIAVIGMLVIADDLFQHITGWSPLRIIYDRVRDKIP